MFTTAATAAVVGLAALAAVVMSQGHDDPVRNGASVNAPVDQWTGLPGLVSTPTGISAPLATGSPSGSPTSAAPTAGDIGTAAPFRSAAPFGTAAPFVLSFAQQPGVTPQPPVPSPTSMAAKETSIDGCDHHYGTNPQCVPWTFPAGVANVADKCAWLAAHGFGPLAVHGEDRQRLDTNLDGVACGTGD